MRPNKLICVALALIAFGFSTARACDPADPPPSIFEFDGSKSKHSTPLGQLLSCDEWAGDVRNITCETDSNHVDLDFYYGPMVYAGASTKLFETVEFLIKVRGYHDHGLEERRGRKFVLDLLKCLDPTWDGSEVFVDQAIRHSLKTWKPQIVRRPEFFFLIRQHHYADLDGDFAWVDITTSNAFIRNMSRYEDLSASNFYDHH